MHDFFFFVNLISTYWVSNKFSVSFLRVPSGIFQGICKFLLLFIVLFIFFIQLIIFILIRLFLPQSYSHNSITICTSILILTRK